MFINRVSGLGSFLREMDRLDSLIYGTTNWRRNQRPALNIWGNEDKLVVTAELPGTKPEDLEISVKGKTLGITCKAGCACEKNKQTELDEKTYYRREREAVDMQRRLTLPFRVNAESVDAKLTNGVLTIALDRAEEDRPKKIAIKTGN